MLGCGFGGRQPSHWFAACFLVSLFFQLVSDESTKRYDVRLRTGSRICGLAGLAAAWGAGRMPSSICCAWLRRLRQSPCLYQSGPSSSIGCWIRSEPLPHCKSVAAQYLSQPQQMRSGFLGKIGNFLAINAALQLIFAALYAYIHL